jgi:hypothetical protein
MTIIDVTRVNELAMREDQKFVKEAPATYWSGEWRPGEDPRVAGFSHSCNEQYSPRR